MKVHIRLWSTIYVFVGFAYMLMPYRSARAQENQPRYIIEMNTDSLVGSAMADQDAFSRHLDGRLDLNSENARNRLEVIDEEHAVFKIALSAVEPQARIDYEFRVLYNGFVAAGIDPEKAADLPGVSSVRPTDGIFYQPFLDDSIDVIDAPAFWNVIGGVGSAGKGIRIAIIDSGIDIENPFFNPDGFTLPTGYPRGDAAYTSSKVIAARAFFRSDDPVDETLDEPTPMDHIGHGSHCAGIAAGNAGTVFDLTGTEVEVVGVAPLAYLMNYKVFYYAESGREGAAEPEIIAAFENAVVDGAEVISCSWGAPDLLGPFARSAEVFRAAVHAGVVVVFAAGNQGPGEGSIAYPASLQPVISVGATETGRGFAGWLDVVSPEPVPGDLAELPAVKGAISPDFEGSFGPVALISTTEAGLGLSDSACEPFPVGAFEGAAALIPRGGCYFSDKIENAANAGALAVVMVNTLEDGLPFEMTGDPVEIPSVLLGEADGLRLEEWLKSHPLAEVIIHDNLLSYSKESEIDQVWLYSSQGPTDRVLVKPELVAPGATQILSAAAWQEGIQGEAWSLREGTSAAAAHVAGAAALVRQLHPDWDQYRVKSALIGSASQDVLPKTAPFLGVGMGRLDLGAARSTGFITIPAVLSLGEARPGDGFEQTIEIVDTSDVGGRTRVSWVHRLGDVAPAFFPVNDSYIELDKEVTVRITTQTTSPIGEYAGYLRIAGDKDVQPARIPYHFRLISDAKRDLLLFDLSFMPEDQTELSDLYRDMAAEAGLDRGFFRATNSSPSPILAELMRYRAVLVFTGNNQVKYTGTARIRAFNRLASYLRNGGRLIAAGQGGFRNVEHPRIHQLMGVKTDTSFPFIDPETGDFIELDSYRVHPTGSSTLIDHPIDIGPADQGIGDLTLVGKLLPIRGAELPEMWSKPFLELEKDYFPQDTYVGVLFDPFEGYGLYTEVEHLSHRVVFLGFGFEQMSNDVPGTTSRQELFDSALDWVMDSIEIDVNIETLQTEVLVTVTETEGEATIYEFDFGDGIGVKKSGINTFYYKYDGVGPKRITVTARSRFGAVAIKRIDFELEPLEDASIVEDTSNTLIEEPEPRKRDCGCRTVGESSIFGMPVVGNFLFVIWSLIL